MYNEKSNNGYCNVWIIGKNGVGKTTLIHNLFKNEYHLSDRTYDTGIDSMVSNDNFNVKLQIIEKHDLKKRELEDFIKFNDNPSVFLIIRSPDGRSGIEYEKQIIEVIQKNIINPVIFIFNNRLGSRLIMPKIGKVIRDIINLSRTDNPDFINFRNVLHNTIINLSTNRLDKVRNKIENSIKNNIEELDLGKSNLTSLFEIPELFNCGHLKKLILSNEWAEFENGKWKREESENLGEYNNIGYIPDEIKKLKNLETLIIGGDWNLDEKVWKRWRIKNITPLSQLSKLKYLNVSNNQLMAIPNLCKLPELLTLHLNNNKITKVYFDGEFTNLKELYLSNNFLNTLAFFSKVKFPKIRTLDIHGNKIRDLEPLKEIIENLNISNSKWEQNTINVAKNPLERPPIEIVNIGRDAILNYFEEVSYGRNYINKDVKLILVGNSEVGKTTLAKYLDNEKDLNIEHLSTHWLEERQISSKHILDKIKQKCTINLFDFGGHDYFHDTHHLFYSSNTIYILLWDKMTNKLEQRTLIQKSHKGESVEVKFQDYPLKYWLDSIKHFIKDDEIEVFDFKSNKLEEYNSDVLVIQNKVETNNEIYHLNNEELKTSYPFIYDFINISIRANRRNLPYFDTILIELLNNTPIIGAKLPGYYGRVKEKISNYSGKPILNIEEFLIFCNSIPRVNIVLKQAKYLANYLKQVGLILYYPASVNNDTIYINKKWVINKIYKILEGLNLKKGEFDFNYLDDLFENSLDKKDKEDIIKLMIDFKIIFINPHSNFYIAPLYLPHKPLKVINLLLKDDLLPYRRFIYLGFIHKNVILNLFQEYGKFVIKDNSATKDFYYYWRDGLIIKDPITGEVVKIQFYLGNDEGNAYIDVFKLTHNLQTEFTLSIIKFINDINKDYDLEETVTVDGIDYISVELLNKNAREGKLVFTEKSSIEKNKPKFVEQKVFKLKDYTMFLENGIKRKKVVISYSKKDLRRINTFIRYLQPLVDLELIETPWYCTLLNPAEEWDNEIQNHFNQADIIFFMVSEYFYSTSYIVEKEIKTAIDRYDNDKSVKIVPIILEHYEWGRKKPYDLQRFSALPYQAKPISDFNNEKLAWNTITASVKQMIEKDLDPAKKEIISKDLQEIYERQVKGKLDKNS
jgi:GTPase SAR1 family protein